MKEPADITIVNVQELLESLRTFAKVTDDVDVDAFVELTESPDAFLRSRLDAHFTASAWLVSVDGARALLMHHAKLDRWLQPGGHADGDTDLARVARREAEEETGLTGLTALPAIFDIDRHRIPGRATEPAHWHYDVRYVVRADGGELCQANEESLALAWVPVATIAADDRYDVSLQRMARRWLARQVS